MLSRDEFLSLARIKTEPYVVKSLDNEEVLLRRMSGSDRDALDIWNIHNYDDDGKAKVGTRFFRAKIVALGIAADESGARLYGDDDISLLDGLDGAVIDELFDAVRKYNCIGQSNKEAVVKNSEEGQNE